MRNLPAGLTVLRQAYETREKHHRLRWVGGCTFNGTGFFYGP
jgi:hypothetical protein